MFIKQVRRGFTLIELLIVIAILGILAVALLLTINPAESQRKARDVKRQTDLKSLTTILDQLVSDAVDLTASCLITANGCSSAAVAAQGQQSCNTNWLQVNVCAYTNTVPLDPSNNQSRSALTFGTPCTLATIATMGYRARVLTGNYKAQVQLESQSNCNKVGNDGGTSANSGQWLEAGSDLSMQIP